MSNPNYFEQPAGDPRVEPGDDGMGGWRAQAGRKGYDNPS